MLHQYRDISLCIQMTQNLVSSLRVAYNTILMSTTLEASYPRTFRAGDATTLGSYLHRHMSVALIGMKRVGISNFLRFFLNAPDINALYIQDPTMVCISVDINNLVER